MTPPAQALPRLRPHSVASPLRSLLLTLALVMSIFLWQNLGARSEFCVDGEDSVCHDAGVGSLFAALVLIAVIGLPLLWWLRVPRAWLVTPLCLVFLTVLWVEANAVVELMAPDQVDGRHRRDAGLPLGHALLVSAGAGLCGAATGAWGGLRWWRRGLLIVVTLTAVSLGGWLLWALLEGWAG